ncbi:MAG: hypothetical protein GYB65_13860 [Chloroflexi bacterium]|nr:hypothetical protein [Chloroflexota bacterium]
MGISTNWSLIIGLALVGTLLAGVTIFLRGNTARGSAANWSLIIGLALIGTLLVGVGIFLPAETCDEDICADESTPLFDYDYFKNEDLVDDGDRFDPVMGIVANADAVLFLAAAFVAVFLAMQQQGLWPVGVSLLLVVAYKCYLVWDTIDKDIDADYLDRALGYGWFVMLAGAGLIALAGVIQALSPDDDIGDYAASSTYQQPQPPVSGQWG